MKIGTCDFALGEKETRGWRLQPSWRETSSPWMKNMIDNEHSIDRKHPAVVATAYCFEAVQRDVGHSEHPVERVAGARRILHPWLQNSLGAHSIFAYPPVVVAAVLGKQRRRALAFFQSVNPFDAC
jgi:hypothetical protein